MHTFMFDACKSTHNPDLTIDSFLPMVSHANIGLIEQLDINHQQSGVWEINFRLKHLFREFGMPQISGDMVLREQSSGTLIAETITDGTLASIKSVSLTISNDPEPHVHLICNIDIDDNCPPLVVAGARRILTKALERAVNVACACRH